MVKVGELDLAFFAPMISGVQLAAVSANARSQR
jgi:hypothetical protein